MGRGERHQANQAKNLLYGPRPAGPGPAEIEEEVVEEASQNLPSVPGAAAETKAALPIKDFKKRGIEKIIIYYDGYGDSGDVNDILISPSNDVEISKVEEGLLRDLAFQLLASRHGGWEINEGSNGSVTLDLQKGTIEHDHYTNYVAQNQTLDEMSLD